MVSCPGRRAARSGALQNRDPYLAVLHGPEWIPALRYTGWRSAASGTREKSYSSLPIATAVSAMRLEKPHSLSYQDITRTSVPF